MGPCSGCGGPHFHGIPGKLSVLGGGALGNRISGSDRCHGLLNADLNHHGMKIMYCDSILHGK